MITFKGELKDIVKTIDKQYILTITTRANNLPEDEITLLKTAKNGVKCDLAQWHEKRSLDSNSYCWVLLDKIADKIGSTKEEVYKSFIKSVGVFETLPIKNTAVERFIKSWQSKGLGWVCEKLGESKIPNYTNVLAYFGTSTYDSAEMTRFINEVVNQAKELGIQTLDELELKQLADEWEKKSENK